MRTLAFLNPTNVAERQRTIDENSTHPAVVAEQQREHAARVAARKAINGQPFND